MEREVRERFERIEATLDLVAESQRKAEARMDRADARMDRFDKQLDGMRKLMRAGMKIVANMQASMAEMQVSINALIEAQQRTEDKLQNLIDSLSQSRDGH